MLKLQLVWAPLGNKESIPSVFSSLPSIVTGQGQAHKPSPLTQKLSQLSFSQLHVKQSMIWKMCSNVDS